MKRIWKWELSIMDEQQIETPVGVQFLDAQMQGSTLCIWGLCDPNRVKRKRRILVRGTGHEHEGGVYIGTAQMAGCGLVWHVFDMGWRDRATT